MDIKDFVRENPSALVRGSISFAEIIERIKSKYNTIDIPTVDIPSLPMHRFNAVNLPSNEILGLTEEQLNFKAIKIPITDESLHYIRKDYVPVNSYNDEEQDYVYLVYEEQVGYKYSNSNKLFLEVALARGVSEEDIENKTEEYICYLFYLQCYLEYTSPDNSN